MSAPLPFSAHMFLYIHRRRNYNLLMSSARDGDGGPQAARARAGQGGRGGQGGRAVVPVDPQARLVKAFTPQEYENACGTLVADDRQEALRVLAMITMQANTGSRGHEIRDLQLCCLLQPKLRAAIGE